MSHAVSGFESSSTSKNSGTFLPFYSFFLWAFIFIYICFTESILISSEPLSHFFFGTYKWKSPVYNRNHFIQCWCLLKSSEKIILTKRPGSILFSNSPTCTEVSDLNFLSHTSDEILSAIQPKEWAFLNVIKKVENCPWGIINVFDPRSKGSFVGQMEAAVTGKSAAVDMMVILC